MCIFFFNDTATTEIYTLSLHDALPISFLWQGGGYFRKGLEAWFTLLIENIWGKRRIMEVYLNIAETGIGTYGVEAGAQRYFGHGADELTRREAGQIAAVLPSDRKSVV